MYIRRKRIIWTMRRAQRRLTRRTINNAISNALMALVAVHHRFVNWNLNWNRLHHGDGNVLHHVEWDRLLDFHRNDFLDGRGHLLLHLLEHLFLHLKKMTNKKKKKKEKTNINPLTKVFSMIKTFSICASSPGKERVSVRLQELDNSVERIQPPVSESI